MAFPSTAATRQTIAAQCAAFPRLASAEPAAGLKHAGVAIALTESDSAPGDAAFLLTRRVSNLRAHGGQWALPGGRCDSGETVVDGALRELEEEIGLKCGPSDVLGLLDDYPTRSDYLITPVIVWSGSSLRLKPNPADVAAVYRIRLADIVAKDVISFERI